MKTFCSYCNTESKLYFRSKDYNRKISQDIFDHYQCPKCKLIFISPLPENMGKYYPQNYYSVPKCKSILETGLNHEKYKIDIIKQYINQGRLLEIGPALGGFAYLAKNSGFEAEAIEMDVKCSEYLNVVAKIPTVNSNDICAALVTLKSYDVITMWHVIEHLPDSWKTLEAIKEKLNPGGILVLAAPNPEAFQFLLLGRYWPHLDSPRHVMLIPIKSLIQRMESFGMRVELVTTSDEGGLGWNIFGWEFFFSNLYSSNKVKKVLRKIGRGVARFFHPIEKIEGKGSAYTLVFRKVA